MEETSFIHLRFVKKTKTNRVSQSKAILKSEVMCTKIINIAITYIVVLRPEDEINNLSSKQTHRKATNVQFIVHA